MSPGMSNAVRTYKHYCDMYCFVIVSPSATKEELMVMTVSEVVSQLIKAHECGQDLNISKYV